MICRIPVNEYDFLLNLSKKMNSGFLKHSDFLGKKLVELLFWVVLEVLVGLGDAIENNADCYM